MFSDSQTNTVYIADALELRHPHLAHSLKQSLSEHGVSLGYIPDTQNIWVRDYLPLQVGDRFVQFRYNGYGQIKQFKQLSVNSKSFPFQTKHSSLYLDGGNCVREGELAIITDTVFRHNKHLSHSKVLARLEKELESEILIIPTEPYDEIGHADGVVKIGNTVLDQALIIINNYRVAKDKKYHKYFDQLVKIFANNYLRVLPWSLPQQPSLSQKAFRKRYPNADVFCTAFGYYINFLLVDKHILLPTFGIDDDYVAYSKLSQLYPNHSIKPIPALDLSIEGGLFNCVTMNYKL